MTTTSEHELVGLSTAQVDALRRRHGFNVVPESSRVPAWRMLLRQVTHLLAVLLWIASVLAVLAGMPELALAIVVIVILNATFAFWQEHRADRSAQRLRSLLPSRTRVVRDGRTTTVEVRDLVPGDLLVLEAGDRVGADARVVQAEALAVDESMMTGESAPVPHGPADRLMSGTFVTQGSGRAVVTAIGDRTALAEISRLTATASRPPSPLTRQLNGVVRVIAVIAGATGIGLGAVAIALGLNVTEALLFGIGVSVALVPEGLLPTVTLSLARGAQLMARRQALVRRLDAVETLGATSFICTDKTGTLTQNRMNVVRVVTSAGLLTVRGDGYAPTARLDGSAAARREAERLARDAVACVTGRVVERGAGWSADGDPMEAALHCLALRCDAPVVDPDERYPYTADRMLSSALVGARLVVLGAPEAVLARCREVPDHLVDELHNLTSNGLRVLAVAERHLPADTPMSEEDLTMLGLLALQDPPREDVAEAIDRCRSAGVRVAMITGDHPGTAAAIARQVGLLGPSGSVLDGPDLPADDSALASAIDHAQGAVIARATPADKLRVARVLREHGHVVAMTGDGVNDAPALREADVGVAMGASGSDVAREAADLVLLDDHFATIVTAVELGRSTFQNVRRFLTYHLTDNVAELAPFALWALTGSNIPLAIGVLQVLALDIGTDMLPALALGAEPPRSDVMRGRHRHTLVDRALLARSFLVLGATEALVALGAFVAVLLLGGWRWGAVPTDALLATASGTAFAAIALGQMANAVACRSTTWFVWRLAPRDNPLVLAAVGAELVLLIIFLGVPGVSGLLGGAWPTPAGWGLALIAVPALLAADSLSKVFRQPSSDRTPTPS